MAGAAGQRAAGKAAEKNISAVINSDPDFYEQGDDKVADDRPRVTGKAAPEVDVGDDPEEAAAAAELDNDKDAFQADKLQNVGDPDAEAIDAEPEGDVDVKEQKVN